MENAIDFLLELSLFHVKKSVQSATSRTKKFQSFLNFALNNYQPPL